MLLYCFVLARLFLLSPCTYLCLAEAIHVANMLYKHGYFFAIEGGDRLVRDDHCLYRYQVQMERVYATVSSDVVTCTICSMCVYIF